jgi:hypothetical protein
MEFEELQKIWDSQSEKPLYAIDEKALHNRILLKKKQAYHISNISELLVILVNSGAGCFILALNLSNQNGNVAIYVLAAWMFASALYVLVSRISRIRGESQFDRSLRGDLSHAISMAMYQVRLSQLMRWNILPIGILSLLGIGIFVFFALAYYAGGWEHGIYIRRKRELELLKAKLEN